ncbi:MAG: hypothetical protein JWR80_8150 [Bradyrhizobium sp.]|nr:hypothetical protein [Bradyrhizobium sp.]
MVTGAKSAHKRAAGVAPSGASHRFGMLDTAVVIAINLMWGFNLVAMKKVIAHVQPFTAGGLRMLLVFLLCLPFLRVFRGRMGPLLAFAATIGGLHLIVINTSLALATNVGALAIVTLLGVPFALLLAAVFLGERIAWSRLLGVFASLAGCVLLLFDPRVAHEGVALAVMALATIIWACGMLVQRRLTGIPIMAIFAWVGLIGAVLLLPLALILEKNLFLASVDLGLSGWGWLLFSAVGPMLLGQGGMTWLLQRHPVPTVMPLVLLAPAVTVIASTLMFGTPLTMLMIIGGCITLAGTTALTVRIARPTIPEA